MAADRGQAKDKAQETQSAAQEKAQQAKEVASEKTQQAAGEAKGRLRQQVDQRSTQAGEQVGSTAGDLRSVGDELRKQGKDKPAQLAEQAAERTEKLGSYLQESDADRILNDIEDFGRRQPWLVGGAGLVLGFAASRFLKASSSKRYESRQSGQAELSDGTAPAYGSSAAGTVSPAVPATPPRGSGAQTTNNPAL